MNDHRRLLLCLGEHNHALLDCHQVKMIKNKSTIKDKRFIAEKIIHYQERLRDFYLPPKQEEHQGGKIFYIKLIIRFKSSKTSPHLFYIFPNQGTRLT